MSESVAFIFKTLIKVPIIIFTAFFIMNCFAFAFIYFKMLGFSYVLMQEVVENNYIAPRQANQVADYLTSLQNEIPMCQAATIIVGLDAAGNPVLWDINSVAGGGSADLTQTYTDSIGNKTYGSLTDFNDGAGHRVQYGKSKTVGVHCEYEFVWPLSYQYTLGGNVEGFSGGININGTVHTSAETGGNSYNSNDDAYALTNLGDFANSAGRAEAYDTGNGYEIKGIVIPIDIYYTVPGLKYYADL